MVRGCWGFEGGGSDATIGVSSYFFFSLVCDSISILVLVWVWRHCYLNANMGQIAYIHPQPTTHYIYFFYFKIFVLIFLTNQAGCRMGHVQKSLSFGLALYFDLLDFI